MRIEIQREFPILCNRNVACLLGDHNCDGVGNFGNTHCRTVAQAKTARDIQVVRHRQYALGSHNAPASYNHSTIVQRSILEEYSLDKTLTDIGIYWLARLDNIIKRHLLFNDNKRTHFLLRHTLARHNYRYHRGILGIGLVIAGKKRREVFEISARAKTLEEAPDFLVKNHNQGNGTHVNHLVEHRTKQTHCQNL